MARWRRWLGVPLTASVALVSALLSQTVLEGLLPVRGALYALTLAAVVYTAHSGGLFPGLVAAILGSAYAIWHYMGLHEIFPRAQDRALLSASVVAITFLIAGMAGLLAERVRRAQAAEHALRLELEEKVEQLKSANESLEAFAYVVSHDLKQPVAGVLGIAEHLAADLAGVVDPEQAEFLALQREEASRLATMLEGLLELSRAERSGNLETASVRVGAALRSPECEGRFAALLASRGATLSVEDHAPPVLVPRSALCQILGNLILNAVLHNPKPTPQVRVEVQPLDGEVEVVVADDGPGFPPDVLAWFNDEVATARGGFGLLIVRRAVQHLGGRVWASTEEGARVHVVLPAASR